MPELEIRRPRKDEMSAAGEVCAEAYQPFLDGPDDPYADRLRDVATRNREAEVWIALLNGEITGCVTVCPPGSPWGEIATDASEGEFRMLAVTPRATGQGVGAALVTHCESRARAHGARAMVLSTLPTMTTAHRMYERLGYRRARERDWAPIPEVNLIAYVKALRTNGTASLVFAVTAEDTAAALGSGSLPVLGTPRLLAWCEAATCAALGISATGETSVGTRVSLEHLAPSPVGSTIEVCATLVHRDGRLHRFAVTARESHLDQGARAGKLIGNAEITRVLVDSERFMARISV